CRSRHSNPRLWPRADDLLDHQGPNQPRINGASQKGLERCALTKSPPRRDPARRIGPVRNFGQRSIPRSIRVRTPSKGVTSRLRFLLRVSFDILLAGSTACSARRAVFRRDGPVAGRFLGAAIGRHAAFDCWRGNGINLSMLSRARTALTSPLFSAAFRALWLADEWGARQCQLRSCILFS